MNKYCLNKKSMLNIYWWISNNYFHFFLLKANRKVFEMKMFVFMWAAVGRQNCPLLY